jgi:DNA-binding transcriptional regulator PaaX
MRRTDPLWNADLEDLTSVPRKLGCLENYARRTRLAEVEEVTDEECAELRMLASHGFRARIFIDPDTGNKLCLLHKPGLTDRALLAMAQRSLAEAHIAEREDFHLMDAIFEALTADASRQFEAMMAEDAA